MAYMEPMRQNKFNNFFNVQFQYVTRSIKIPVIHVGMKFMESHMESFTMQEKSSANLTDQLSLKTIFLNLGPRKGEMLFIHMNHNEARCNVWNTPICYAWLKRGAIDTDVLYTDVLSMSSWVDIMWYTVKPLALLQLHLHSRLNNQLQWIRQRQLQDLTRII